MLCTTLNITDGGDNVKIMINAESVELTVNDGDEFELALWDSRWKSGIKYIISDVLPTFDTYITTLTTDVQGYAFTPLKFTNSGTAIKDMEIQAKEDTLTGGLKSNIVLVHIKPRVTPPPPTPGFVISADPVKGPKGFISHVTISKPDSPGPGQTVDIVIDDGWGHYSCLYPNIELDTVGKATVDVTVASSNTIMATFGYGCCDVHTNFCTDSNKILLTVEGEWGWETYLMVGAVVIAGAYVLGKSMERK